MNWYKKSKSDIVNIDELPDPEGYGSIGDSDDPDSQESSKARKYFSIGHGDFNEEFGGEPDFLVWILLDGRIQKSNVFKINPETGETDGEGGETHNRLWGKLQDFNYKGRYEPQTGRLTVVKPAQQRFREIPNEVINRIQSAFPKAKQIIIAKTYNCLKTAKEDKEDKVENKEQEETQFQPVPVNVNAMAPEILSLINKKMKSLGYDWRGPEDVKALIKKHNNTLFSLDLYNAYKSALESSSKRSNTLENKKKEKQQYPSVNWKRVKELGYTNDIKEAGYITPEGNLIDLSGKKEGGFFGGRNLDHRELGGTAGMQEFVASGNIRMSITGGMGSCFFDIRSNPTQKQKNIIKNIVPQINGEIYLELQNGLGQKEKSYYLNSEKRTEKTYTKGDGEQIIKDIDSFFNPNTVYDSPLKRFLSNNNWYRVAEQTQQEFGFLQKDRDDEYKFLEEQASNIDKHHYEILKEYHDKKRKRGTKMSWSVVPFARLKRIWEDYAKLGFVRDIKGLQEIERQILNNLTKLQAATDVGGHGGDADLDEISEELGVKPIDGNNTDFYFDFLNTEYGEPISDYGLPKLWEIAKQFPRARIPEERLLLIDQMLNVIHQRGDLAALFVEGGSKSLSQLSGM